MKLVIIVFMVVFFQSCEIRAQKEIRLDRVLVDTTMWVSTDTIFTDFNGDKLEDLMFVFDKYKDIIRPNGIQTLVSIYMGAGKNEFKYFKTAEKIICLPSYKINEIPGGFSISQNGVGDDTNFYINYYRFNENDLIMFKEQVDQITIRLKVDEETGEIKENEFRNTIYANSDSVSIEKYRSIDFISKYKSR